MENTNDRGVSLVVMQNRSVPASTTNNETVHALAAAVVTEITCAYRAGDVARGNRLYGRLKCLAAG